MREEKNYTQKANVDKRYMHKLQCKVIKNLNMWGWLGTLGIMIRYKASINFDPLSNVRTEGPECAEKGRALALCTEFWRGNSSNGIGEVENIGLDWWTDVDDGEVEGE